jgi:hypothetical protein
MLQLKPERRPTLARVLGDPFFHGVLAGAAFSKEKELLGLARKKLLENEGSDLVVNMQFDLAKDRASSERLAEYRICAKKWKDEAVFFLPPAVIAKCLAAYRRRGSVGEGRRKRAPQILRVSTVS